MKLTVNAITHIIKYQNVYTWLFTVDVISTWVINFAERKHYAVSHWVAPPTTRHSNRHIYIINLQRALFFFFRNVSRIKSKQSKYDVRRLCKHVESARILLWHSERCNMETPINYQCRRSIDDFPFSNHLTTKTRSAPLTVASNKTKKKNALVPAGCCALVSLCGCAYVCELILSNTVSELHVPNTTLRLSFEKQNKKTFYYFWRYALKGISQFWSFAFIRQHAAAVFSAFGKEMNANMSPGNTLAQKLRSVPFASPPSLCLRLFQFYFSLRPLCSGIHRAALPL